MRVDKMKSMIMLMVLLGLFLSVKGAVCVRAEERQDELKEKEVYTAGYELVMQGADIIEFGFNGNILLQARYEDGMRIWKKGYSESLFEYEGALLICEERDGKVIKYNTIFDPEENTYRYTGYETEEECFLYIYDDENRISGIADFNGNSIAKYVYNGLYVEDVLQKQGEEWISNVNPEFCGNFNKLRSYQTYFDDETHLFYSNGVYDDVLNGKIVGKRDNSEFLSETNPFSAAGMSEADIMPLGYEDTDWEAENWASQLLADSSFNAAKGPEYWKSANVQTVEIVARVIYGENTFRTLDQRAIAWVILNRYHANRKPTIREIVTEDNEFGGLFGFQGTKAQNSSDSGWRNAVYLACLMLTDSSEACWNSVSPRPIGITDQCYFRSAGKLGNEITDGNNCLKLNGVEIINVCISGNSPASSVAELINQCVGGVSTYNVFFSYK